MTSSTNSLTNNSTNNSTNALTNSLTNNLTNNLRGRIAIKSMYSDQKIPTLACQIPHILPNLCYLHRKDAMRLPETRVLLQKNNATECSQHKAF